MIEQNDVNLEDLLRIVLLVLFCRKNNGFGSALAHQLLSDFNDLL